MPAEYPRSRRVGEQIQRELMDILRRGVKDPRVGGVTISAVRVSRDLSHARVFFTLLDKQQDIAEITAVLQRAAGFMRHALSQELMLRTVPQLKFEHDDSIAHAAYMEDLISRANKNPADDEQD